MDTNEKKDIPSEDRPNITDPQENEKDGNVFGPAFDTVNGDSFGRNSASNDAGDANEMPVNNIKGENQDED